MKKISIENVDISFRIKGTGKINIILLHGFGASSETWNDIEPFMLNNFKLFLIDLKGFGCSSKPKDSKYTLADHADLILKFAEKLNIKECILIGHSYGGAIAIILCHECNNLNVNLKIKRLVLIDPAAYEQDLPLFVKLLSINLLNWFIMNIISSRMKAKFVLNNLFFDKNKVTNNIINRYAKYFKVEGTSYSFVKAAKQIHPENVNKFYNYIKEIRIPTLIIWGENDSVLLLNSAIKLRDNIIKSKLVIIPKCGHIPHEEKPKECAHFILEFII